MDKEIRIGVPLILVFSIVFGFVFIRQWLEVPREPVPAGPDSAPAAMIERIGAEPEADVAADATRGPTFVAVSEAASPTIIPSPKLVNEWSVSYADAGEPAVGLTCWKVPNLPMPASTDPPCTPAEPLE